MLDDDDDDDDDDDGDDDDDDKIVNDAEGIARGWKREHAFAFVNDVLLHSCRDCSLSACCTRLNAC